MLLKWLLDFCGYVNVDVDVANDVNVATVMLNVAEVLLLLLASNKLPNLESFHSKSGRNCSSFLK